MKTQSIGALSATFGSLLACATLAAAFTPTIPPEITSPSGGTIASPADPLLIEVEHGDLPIIQSIEILANDVPIGWAYTTDFFGEWGFPNDAHLSVMHNDWGAPGDPPVMLDYHPDADSPMMFFSGEFVSPTRFSGTYEINTWPNPPTGNATIDFNQVDGKVNVVITGDGALGVHEHTSGALFYPQDDVQFRCEWTSPESGEQSLKAKITFTDPDTMMDEVLTTNTVLVTISSPAAPEIAVEAPEGTDLISGQSTISMPNVLLGKKSSPLLVTIRNLGDAPLTDLSIATLGAHPSDFVISSLSATALDPEEATQFSVSFKPSAKGKRTATLQVASNDSDENPFVIELEGNATTAPEISVQSKGQNLKSKKSTTNFGKVVRRSTSKAYTYTIRNDGSAPLKNLKVIVAGIHRKDFPFKQPSLSRLNPGQNTNLRIRFSPRRTGTRKAELRIVSNDADENPFRVALRGTGKSAATRK